MPAMNSPDPATLHTQRAAALSTGASSAAKPRRLESELRRAWLLLLLDRDAKYGYQLRLQLEASGLIVEPTAVYRTLRKLEGDGCVASSWGKSVAGPPRRLYRVTPTGRLNLDQLTETVTVARDLYNMFLFACAEPPRRPRDDEPGEQRP